MVLRHILRHESRTVRPVRGAVPSRQLQALQTKLLAECSVSRGIGERISRHQLTLIVVFISSCRLEDHGISGSASTARDVQRRGSEQEVVDTIGSAGLAERL